MDVALLWTAAGSVAGIAAVTLGAWQIRLQFLERRDPARSSGHPGGLPVPAIRGQRREALSGEAGRTVPGQLPADVPAFTGREGELAELDRLVGIGAAGEELKRLGSGVVVAVSGMAGVGKTALVTRWSHRCQAAFPDGQLYVNLRGFDTEQPLLAGDALTRFLRALGVTGGDIPVEVHERAARYRTETAGRQMLVVLDNAADAEQVRPLLPGAAGCLALVTSRDSLAGLVAREGARRMDLNLLPAGDSLTLLRELIGTRVDTEPAAAEALIRYCAQLPLALRVAAEQATFRPSASLGELAAELASEQRLDMLNADSDSRAAVYTVFSWSYRHLPAEIRRTFRMLGLHPGPDLDAFAAAALAGSGIKQARQHLDRLARASLITSASPGRYELHDLLRLYAGSLAEQEDTHGQRQAALNRSAGYYLVASSAAMDILYPAEHHNRPQVPSPRTPVPQLGDAAAAKGWLDTERASLVAVASHSATSLRQAGNLAAAIYRYLYAGGYHSDAMAVYARTRNAAHIAGDLPAEARDLVNVGVMVFTQGDSAEAGRCFHQALDLFRQVSDQAGQARALFNIGDICWRYGPVEHAESYYQQALALYRTTGHRVSEADLLARLGDLYLRQHRNEDAARQLHEAMIIYHQVQHQAGEAEALCTLGHLLLRERDLTRAMEHHRRALALYLQVGHQIGEAQARNGIGETLQAMGYSEQACKEHQAALTIASRSGDLYEQARAHEALAESLAATGASHQAHRHQISALNLYTSLGVPEADDIRARLAAYKTPGQIIPFP